MLPRAVMKHRTKSTRFRTSYSFILRVLRKYFQISEALKTADEIMGKT